MIGGILLAAGRSQRMGQPKLALPWKNGRPIIAHMAELFRQAAVDPIIVVTGADRSTIEACLENQPVVTVHNPDYTESGMIDSVRIGLRSLQETPCTAVLISPGDLPAMQVETIRSLIAAFKRTEASIVAPSIDGRRGHPVLVSRSEWMTILEMPEDRTLREFLLIRSESIHHVVVEDPGIVFDLDVPEDYYQASEVSG
jgi:molybdenum cofactor cytidylyltransferase